MAARDPSDGADAVCPRRAGDRISSGLLTGRSHVAPSGRAGRSENVLRQVRQRKRWLPSRSRPYFLAFSAWQRWQTMAALLQLAGRAIIGMWGPSGFGWRIWPRRSLARCRGRLVSGVSLVLPRSEIIVGQITLQVKRAIMESLLLTARGFSAYTNGMARPKAEQTQSVSLRLRMFPEQEQLIRQAAGLAGISISAWIRGCRPDRGWETGDRHAEEIQDQRRDRSGHDHGRPQRESGRCGLARAEEGIGQCTAGATAIASDQGGAVVAGSADAWFGSCWTSR